MGVLEDICWDSICNSRFWCTELPAGPFLGMAAFRDSTRASMRCWVSISLCCCSAVREPGGAVTVVTRARWFSSSKVYAVEVLYGVKRLTFSPLEMKLMLDLESPAKEKVNSGGNDLINSSMSLPAYICLD